MWWLQGPRGEKYHLGLSDSRPVSHKGAGMRPLSSPPLESHSYPKMKIGHMIKSKLFWLEGDRDTELLDRGSWATQPVMRPTLDFSSDRDLMVVRLCHVSGSVLTESLAHVCALSLALKLSK